MYKAIVNHYREIILDLNEVKVFIFAAILIFVAGNVVAILIPTLGENILRDVLVYLKPFKNKNALELVIAIFWINASSALFSILLSFLLLPIVGAAFNGITMGAVLNQNPLNFFMLLPHGIFELSAIFIAWGLGLWCAGAFFPLPSLELIKFRMKRSLNIYFSIIVPLLVIAAIIETLGIKYYSAFK
jgi:stage II sporulation protein M